MKSWTSLISISAASFTTGISFTNSANFLYWDMSKISLDPGLIKSAKLGLGPSIRVDNLDLVSYIEEYIPLHLTSVAFISYFLLLFTREFWVTKTHRNQCFMQIPRMVDHAFNASTGHLFLAILVKFHFKYCLQIWSWCIPRIKSFSQEPFINWNWSKKAF